MRQVLLLAEGQTEELFVKRVLGPHLETRDIYVQPVIVETKRVASGKKYRGGISSWQKVERDVRKLLGNTHVAAVTTMIDLYGLPDDWPGCEKRAASPLDKVAAAEAAMHAAVGGDRRFVPFLTLHEFEALLFAAPETCARHAGMPGLERQLHDAVASCGSPEHVNDGLQTAPSKRLKAVWPAYAKTTDGPALTATIGLSPLRAACPHFDSWVTKLEDL